MSAVGLRVGPFEIVAPAAVPEGGDWYLAHRTTPSERRPTAVWIKLLPADAPAAAVQRLQQEFEHLRQIEGRVPTPVAFYEGHRALVVQAAVGLPLSVLLAQSAAQRVSLGISTWLDLIIDLAETVQRAHGLGRIHGHLDADHVWIDRQGDPVLWGFGPGTAASATSAWTAPERARGEPTSQATDQWGLAALLAGVLAGRAPWAGADPYTEALSGRADDLTAPLHHQHPGLARTLDTMLASNASERFESVQEARQALMTHARRIDGISQRRELGRWAADLLAESLGELGELDDVSQEMVLEDLPDQDDLSEVLDPVLADSEPTVLYTSHDLAAQTHAEGDFEPTVLFYDRPHPDIDTDLNRRIEEGVLDEEDSLAQERSLSDLPAPVATEPLVESDDFGLPPMALETEEAGMPIVPMILNDDEDTGPYHLALDLTEIDTQPNESLHGVRSPLPLPPREMSAPERVASFLLATLAGLLLLWAFLAVLA